MHLMSLQGPFLYSMLGRKKDDGRILWVQGDPAEVILDVSNPIPCELKMEKMVSECFCTPSTMLSLGCNNVATML